MNEILPHKRLSGTGRLEQGEDQTKTGNEHAGNGGLASSAFVLDGGGSRRRSRVGSSDGAVGDAASVAVVWAAPGTGGRRGTHTINRSCASGAASRRRGRDNKAAGVGDCSVASTILARVRAIARIIATGIIATLMKSSVGIQEGKGNFHILEELPSALPSPGGVP